MNIVRILCYFFHQIAVKSCGIVSKGPRVADLPVTKTPDLIQDLTF